MTEVYVTQPKLHRSAVTAVDAADPEGTAGAIDSHGYRECRFDITLSGVGLSSLEVQALFWNPRQEKWFGGAKRVFTTAGQHALVVESRGAVIFLKVMAFTGTSFSLSVDYTLG